MSRKKRRISLAKRAPSAPALHKGFLKTITAAVGQAIGTASGIIADFLGAIGASEVISVPGAATLFAAQVGFRFHGERQMEKLKRLFEDLKKKAEEGKGFLIDFKDERNLQGLFDKVMDFLEAQNELKADLLRRVVLNGLIQRPVDEVKEANFRYAIKHLEAEDVQLLRHMTGLAHGDPRPVITQEGQVPALMEPAVIRRRELNETANFSLARLQAIGLIEAELAWNEPAFRVTKPGGELLNYLQRL